MLAAADNMTSVQILSACLAWLVLIGLVYRHITFTKIKECYGMWFTKEYWTDYNRVEFASQERDLRLMLSFGLSQRTGEWWDSRRKIAQRDNYVEKLRQVIMRERKDLEQRLPWHWHHMYIRLCVINNIDTSSWNFKPVSEKDSKMVEAYFAYQKARNQYISESNWPNYYQWLKTHRFHNLSSGEILRELNPKLSADA